jgi:predicted enzyme related to lactoylglutathione lyase
MPSRDTAAPGTPCWVDVQTSDVERARAFYPEVLGWQALPGSEEFGGYFMFTRNGVPVAGGMPADAQAPTSDVWSVYLASEDAAKTLEAAAAAGGQVVVQPMPVADLGTMAFTTDAGGAGIGVWQPGTFHGFGLLAEHGAPAWFEVHTRDYARTVAFYREVFGLEPHVMSDTDEFRYTTLHEPGSDDQVAGVMDTSGLPADGVPAHWQVYFGVDDTDAAVATVERLGGTVRTPAADTEHGRIAAVSDPMGADFLLVAPNASMPARTG